MLAQAILKTVLYADLFDYPLTAREIHRYLIQESAAYEDVVGALAVREGPLAQIHERDGWFMLAGREALVDRRQARAAHAASLWPKAIHFGRRIASLPFARMVAVTGALAMENEGGQDVDFLVVTQTGRLWLCRALAILWVRWAARTDVTLCPNYFLSEKSLSFMDRNLFSAHEFVQMIPLTGRAVYQKMVYENQWVAAYLPNAFDMLPPSLPVKSNHRESPYNWKTLGERLLQSPLGSWIEDWERRRKVERFSARSGEHPEAAFCADWCKGHFGNYSQRTLTTFQERWLSLNTVAGAASPNQSGLSYGPPAGLDVR